MNAGDVEVAVARLIGYREHCIVPNVSWGLGLNHECDMLVLDNKNRFTEIEIKVSASDLKRDFSKSHGHRSKIISRLVYAVPEELWLSHGEIIPKCCGVIVVFPYKAENKVPTYKAKWERRCRHNSSISPVSDIKIRKFMELGVMRIWSLKEHLLRLKREKNLRTKA